MSGTAGSGRTVGRAIVEVLRAAGVDLAVTVPGESFLPILEALADARIRVVATRHEGGAGFIAEAYGQLTRRPALCLVTRAVGATNLAIAVHTARQDSTPLIVIVGGVERALRRREAFQDADIAATLGGLAKWAAEAQTAADAPALVAEAVTRAVSGRPGPVMVVLPEDLLDEALGEEERFHAHRPEPPEPDSSAVHETIRLLAAAERPAILAGGGVLRAGATADLVAIAEMLEVPVFAAWRRPDVFPNHHALYLGMSGFGASSTVAPRLRDADVLLVVGCRLSEVTSFSYTVPAETTRWIHVDLEPRGGGSGLPAPELAVLSDAATFLGAARRRLGHSAVDAAAVAGRRSRNEADRAAFREASVVDAEPWSGPGVHPGRVVRELGRQLPPNAILTTDAGNFAGWLARGYRFVQPGTFLGPTSGAMGYGLPAAIAAGLASPGARWSPLPVTGASR